MIVWLRRFTLPLVFFLTGVGNAVVGATLPAALHRWHLSDARGGLLLLATWSGSTAGAMLARQGSGSGVAMGSLLSATGLLALVLAPAVGLPFWYALYGLGLGVSMTSISLIRAREVEPAFVEIELNRLNLVWALGALCAPGLCVRSLRQLSVAHLFGALSSVFAGAAVLACLLLLRERRTNSPLETVRAKPRVWAPLGFCLFAAAAVGLESAIGSWLTTYAGRAAPGVREAVSANAAFWAGLLLSRGLHSLASVRFLHTARARVLHMAAAGVALLLLIAVPLRGLLPAEAFLFGAGLGPLYPWALSVVLPRFRATAIFVFAGIGASVTPWMTGAVSSLSGSLRLGLLAPGAAFLLLWLTSLRLRSVET